MVHDNKNKMAPDSFCQSPIFLLIILTVIIFIEEFGAHYLALHLIPDLTAGLSNLLDSLILVLIIFPFLIYFVLRPLNLQIAERKLSEQALREHREQLRYLTAQLMKGQEQERLKIAHELHDDLGQTINAMKLQVRFIEKSLQTDQKKAIIECHELSRQLDEVIENIRRLSRELNPSFLEDLGITAALQYLLDNFSKSYEVRVALLITDLDHLFSQETQFIIYRIVQEALINIGKHAGARNVSFKVREHEDRVDFFIEDDGHGFDVQGVGDKDLAKKGLGLTIMEERARIAGGSLVLKSQEDQGTILTFSIPILAEGETT